MKRILDWQVKLGLLLIALSALVYLIHFAIFRDVHHIFIYLIGDIAFVFFEVLMVTLVIHQLLHHREKKALLNKLNMVIGAFFSEVGTDLLKTFSGFDPNAAKIIDRLIIDGDWSDEEFTKVRTELKRYDCAIDITRADLENVRKFLKERRQFLLTLLENPNLLEHESFTNLLWAVFHLTEELVHRKDLRRLPETDYQHLAGDMKRAYRQLLSEWLDYMKHLKKNYSYLFSLAMRTNPFDSDASVEVK
ncbi:hypothetical protein ACFL1E_04700 [Candidatus Omnitrophota bacterium]